MQYFVQTMYQQWCNGRDSIQDGEAFIHTVYRIANYDPDDLREYLRAQPWFTSDILPKSQEK